MAALTPDSNVTLSAPSLSSRISSPGIKEEEKSVSGCSTAGGGQESDNEGGEREYGTENEVRGQPSQQSWAVPAPPIWVGSAQPRPIRFGHGKKIARFGLYDKPSVVKSASIQGDDEEHEERAQSPADLEASTIRLSSTLGIESISQDAPSEASTIQLSPAPETTTSSHHLSATSTPSVNRRATKAKEASPPLPNPIPQTMSQWAALPKPVRMKTPLPPQVPRVLSEEIALGAWKEYNALRVDEKRKVIEVVEKSWREGDEVCLSVNPSA
jgi:hypothetical protein